MNANELAEIQAFKTEELTMWERNHTATMLRQQQAEIEALKAGKIRAYDNGVEDGRKPNTNPVKDLEDIDINITWNENSMRDFGKDELNFARAILRKASEK